MAKKIKISKKVEEKVKEFFKKQNGDNNTQASGGGTGSNSDQSPSNK